MGQYPVTYEEYHVFTQSDILPTVCESWAVAAQYIQSLPSGSIVTVEHVTSTHRVYGVYGTAMQPLPPAPNPSVTLAQYSIAHQKRG